MNDPYAAPAARDLAHTVVEEIRGVLSAIEVDQIERLADTLHTASRVMVSGEGRSGLMARAFAMRLMHLGLAVHVVGETTTPAVTADDTLIAVSGSGSTAATVRTAEQARHVGAYVHAVTTDPGSAMAAAAAAVLVVPAATKHRRSHEAATIQPLSSLFDQATHLVFDVVCLRLAHLRGIDNTAARSAHANTE